MGLSNLFHQLWSFVDFYSIAILLAVYFSISCLMWHGSFSSKKNLAPGIYGLPLVGIMPYFVHWKQTFFERLEASSKKYGPVIRLNLGKQTMIVVTGTEAVREAMLNDDLLGRPKNQSGVKELDSILFKDSIINIEGDLWKKHRRFSLITLRDLGFGKTPIMEQRIQEEISDLVKIIDANDGEPFDIQPALVESTGNNMHSLVFGGKIHTVDGKKERIYKLMIQFRKEIEKLVRFSFIPFALLAMVKLKLSVVNTLREISNSFSKFVKEDVEFHKEDLDEDNPRDYVDHYLIEQKKDKDFTPELVEGNAMAFFFAGSSTVRVTTEYLIHLMAQYPEVQRKVQHEIDEVTGGSRVVTWADSPQLVYTMAVITERHRYNTVAPAGVTRKVMRPTKLCGYDLEVNNQIIFNIDSVHFDPAVFENPYEFRPERFIDENGTLVNTEKVWAFSIGKRACPGETLAVLEVFLYFATLLQNYTIEAVGPVMFKPARSFLSETIAQKLRFIRRG